MCTHTYIHTSSLAVSSRRQTWPQTANTTAGQLEPQRVVVLFASRLWEPEALRPCATANPAASLAACYGEMPANPELFIRVERKVAKAPKGKLTNSSSFVVSDRSQVIFDGFPD